MFDKHRSNKQVSPQIKETIAPSDSPPMVAREPAAAARSAVIGPGITIAGDVTASSDLYINGKIGGSEVQCSQSVEIGESGHVTARIRAKMIKVSGEVRGDIMASEKVLITKTGRVQGNVTAPRVQLEDGAMYKGSIDMTPAKAAKPAAPRAEQKGAERQSVSPPGPDAVSRSSGSSASKSGSGAASVSGAASAKDSTRKEPSLTLKSG